MSQSMRVVISVVVLSSLLHADSVLDTIKSTSSSLANKASSFASQAASKAKSVTNDISQKAAQELLAKYRKPFPHQTETARVRTGTALGDSEIAFRAAREPIIRIGLGKLLGRAVTEPRVPTIGLCMSGGGYRAMLLSMSFMGGLQKMGVLDAAMYCSALSGSTWSLLYWLVSGKTSRGSLNTLIETAGRGQIIPAREWNDVIKVLTTKKAYGQMLTIVDVWGAYLAEQILSDIANQQDYVFSQLSERVASGQVPFPIGTTVSDNIISRATQYQWFECSPFEFGSTFLNAWIPTWSAGRTFNNGVSTNAVPEQTLGFWMGVFGSAFSLSIGDIIDHAPGIMNNELLTKSIKSFAQPAKDAIGVQRIIEGAKIPNFAYGLATAPATAQDKKILELVDAGLACNLPVPPLLRPERGLDIIIMCDASHPVAGGKELRCAQEYARQNNLKFPAIDYTIAGRQNVSVFGTPSDPQSLVIIYIPRMSNRSLPAPYGSFDMDAAAGLSGFAGTQQFKYSLSNAQLMTGYFEQNVAAQKQIIQDVMKLRLKALNP